MKKYLIIIIGFLSLWFIASYFFARGGSCGFCSALPENLQRVDYMCIGRNIQKSLLYIDGGNEIRCVGLALPIKQCYYFTGTGNSVRQADCK